MLFFLVFLEAPSVVVWLGVSHLRARGNTFLHITHFVSSRHMTKIGLLILLAHLKFCLRVLNFAGAVFEVKVAPANDLRQHNFAGGRQ